MSRFLHGPEGGLLRRTIGFRNEVVAESEEQEPFAVTGGTYIAPTTMEYSREFAPPTGKSPKTFARRVRVR